MKIAGSHCRLYKGLSYTTAGSPALVDSELPECNCASLLTATAKCGALELPTCRGC